MKQSNDRLKQNFSAFASWMGFQKLHYPACSEQRAAYGGASLADTSFNLCRKFGCDSNWKITLQISHNFSLLETNK